MELISVAPDEVKYLMETCDVNGGVSAHVSLNVTDVFREQGG